MVGIYNNTNTPINVGYHTLGIGYNEIDTHEWNQIAQEPSIKELIKTCSLLVGDDLQVYQTYSQTINGLFNKCTNNMELEELKLEKDKEKRKADAQEKAEQMLASKFQLEILSEDFAGDIKHARKLQVISANIENVIAEFEKIAQKG